MELIQGLETYRGTKAVEGDCYVILPSMFYLHLPPPGSKSLGLTSRRDENKGLFYLAAALYQLPTVIAVNKILVLSHGGRALFSYFFRDTCPPPCICPPVPSPDTSNAFQITNPPPIIYPLAVHLVFFFLLDSLPTARTLFGGTLSRPLTCSSVSTWLKEFIYLCPCPFPRLSSFQVASQSQDCPSEGLKFGPKVLVIGIQFSHKFSHGPHLVFVLFSRQPEGEQAARFPLL